jgi:hypothetical protein
VQQQRLVEGMAVVDLAALRAVAGEEVRLVLVRLLVLGLVLSVEVKVVCRVLGLLAARQVSELPVVQVVEDLEVIGEAMRPAH